MESPDSPDQVRARLTEDLANGKTIVLSSRDLDDPQLREQLPRLLEDLNRGTPHAPGVRIPGYQLLGEIGQGGMSTVYLARQEKLGRHVAVKVAPKWLGGGARATERLVQEARAMARVTHNNIVAIHDIVDVDDTFAIAMEWVDGRTLAGLLRSLPSTPSSDDLLILTSVLGTPAEARDRFEGSTTRLLVSWMRDMALAAQAVHDAGLLHLDIKPSNVLVRRDGTPLLADFGVVREIAPETDHTRTFAGTPVYSPPEQIRRDDARIGPTADVYSLGMTLYELLARSQPLRALDLAGIVECVESGRMPRLSQKAAVTPDLENIVHKAIEPEPENRYRTAQAFADDLLAFLEHRPVTARPLTRMQRLRRWARIEPWKAALAASMAVLLPLLLGLGTYLMVQLPALERIEELNRLRQANQLKQQSFQLWLTRSRNDNDVVAMMSRAVELDPSIASVVTNAVLHTAMGWQPAAEFLAQRPEPVRDCLGLQLLAAACADRRTFFDQQEYERLRASPHPIDHYLLALERTFYANDHRNVAAHAVALRAIEAAALVFHEDPLLYGLMAWTSRRADDQDKHDTACRSIHARWPDDPMAVAWTALSVEPFDGEKARRIAREIIAFAPGHSRGYELLTGAHRRNERFDEAAKVLAQARAAGVRSPELDRFQLLLDLQFGERQIDEATLERLHFGVSTGARLNRIFEIDKPLAARLAREILTVDHPSPYNLSAAYSVAGRLGDDDLMEASWQRYREMYRDHQALHSSRMRDLYRAGRIPEAAELCAEFTLDHTNQKAYQSFLPFVVRCLMRVKDWQNVRRQALHWLAHSDGANYQQAASFAGMAASRLGDHRDAAEKLAIALHDYHPNTGWYVTSLLEDAWLRCGPGHPESLRTPTIARRLLERFDELNDSRRSPQSGPWTQLVRAQVLWANGEHAAAREQLERSPRVRGREPHAPADLNELYEAARQRMK